MSCQSQNEPGIFEGLTAWFSTSVNENRKKKWGKEGGEEAELEKALFVFSEDARASDTSILFENEAYLREHMAIFHAAFIDECVRLRHINAVAVGKYFLPSEQLYQEIKNNLRFKWEESVKYAINVVSKQKRDSKVGMKQLSSGHAGQPKDDIKDFEDDVPMYDIEELEQVQGPVTQFTPGEDGCQVTRL